MPTARDSKLFRTFWIRRFHSSMIPPLSQKVLLQLLEINLATSLNLEVQDGSATVKGFRLVALYERGGAACFRSDIGHHFGNGQGFVRRGASGRDRHDKERRNRNCPYTRH